MSIGFLKIGGQFPIDNNINPNPPSVERPFFVLQNGITIRLKSGYPAGTIGQADGDASGKIYTAVDNTMLFALNPLTDDYTSVCTTLCTDFTILFASTSFNQNISNWDTANVVDMETVFSNNPVFNQPIGVWDTSKVKIMARTFRAATAFNQPLNDWNVSSVNNFVETFRGATAFNQPLNNWNPISATNMRDMFKDMSYNQDIGNWNVSNVTNMTRMFDNNNQFNQDLTGWCVTNIPTEPSSFAESTFLTANRPQWGLCP